MPIPLLRARNIHGCTKPAKSEMSFLSSVFEYALLLAKENCSIGSSGSKELSQLVFCSSGNPGSSSLLCFDSLSACRSLAFALACQASQACIFRFHSGLVCFQSFSAAVSVFRRNSRTFSQPDRSKQNKMAGWGAISKS